MAVVYDFTVQQDGFSYTCPDNTDMVYLEGPANGYTQTCNITLPPNPVDGQVITIISDQNLPDDGGATTISSVFANTGQTLQFNVNQTGFASLDMSSIPCFSGGNGNIWAWKLFYQASTSTWYPIF